MPADFPLETVDMQSGLNLASLIGVVSMVALPNDPQFYVLASTAITVGGSLCLQIIRNRQEEKRYARDRQERLDHQDELKAELERTTQAAINAQNAAALARREIKVELQENTELTRQGLEKTQEFAAAANHVQEKFVVLARAAGVEKGLELLGVQTIALDTNDTVHRIEDAGAMAKG